MTVDLNIYKKHDKYATQEVLVDMRLKVENGNWVNIEGFDNESNGDYPKVSGFFKAPEDSQLNSFSWIGIDGIGTKKRYSIVILISLSEDKCYFLLYGNAYNDLSDYIDYEFGMNIIQRCTVVDTFREGTRSISRNQESTLKTATKIVDQMLIPTDFDVYVKSSIENEFIPDVYDEFEPIINVDFSSSIKFKVKTLDSVDDNIDLVCNIVRNIDTIASGDVVESRPLMMPIYTYEEVREDPTNDIREKLYTYARRVYEVYENGVDGNELEEVSLYSGINYRENRPFFNDDFDAGYRLTFSRKTIDADSGDRFKDLVIKIWRSLTEEDENRTIEEQCKCVVDFILNAKICGDIDERKFKRDLIKHIIFEIEDKKLFMNGKVYAYNDYYIDRVNTQIKDKINPLVEYFEEVYNDDDRLGFIDGTNEILQINKYAYNDNLDFIETGEFDEIDLSDKNSAKKKLYRERYYNYIVCERDDECTLLDRMNCRIDGSSIELCDIHENRNDSPPRYWHVKFGGCSDLTYCFHQAEIAINILKSKNIDFKIGLWFMINTSNIFVEEQNVTTVNLTATKSLIFKVEMLKFFSRYSDFVDNLRIGRQIN